MLSVIFKSVLAFLAVYAVIDIVRHFICAFFIKTPAVKDDVFVVIKVKKCTKCIEGVVRSIIWKSLRADGGGFVPSILIVNMGADAETEDIAQRLCSEYGFIYYTTEEKYQSMKDSFLKD
ncbi:MAG: hypothetical protein SPF92_04985 [Clostridia bacterium]|nr:hypothetical protein [Clostridia bacterium]